ncbi:CHRD domain-containing protein [Lacibacter sediminis]|uniref:CHRD domain-containing protein n=1 Tax=Lacibacter sediminis TaxID=2760713 RepID=A0A7G5XCD0_9BACT|nr:CHRD domain-containing protein [Lacibacter sediminis]QNA43133.1 CHRD domain-containing protein [Lacibacter sediminis]
MKKNYLNSPWRVRCLLFLIVSCSILKARADRFPFIAIYSGANEVPANASTGGGGIIGVYDDATNTIYYNIAFGGLSAATTAAHFHAPAGPGVNAGVTLAHVGFPTGVTTGNYTKIDVFTDAQETNLKAGLMYSNIHTSAFPGGEIRAQIVLGAASTEIYTFKRTYSGANEVPANASTATGTIMGAYNAAINRIFYSIEFSGLSANAIAAHFHAPAMPDTTAPVTLGNAGFPTGVTSGVYRRTNVFNDVQEKYLLAGLMYSNIHTTLFPGGEIRTQIFFDAPFVAPVVTCPANITVSNDAGLCSASVAFEATVTGSPDYFITYKVDGKVIFPGYIFPVGTTTVKATAINGGGISTCSFTVTVNDTEAPQIYDLKTDPVVLWPANGKMRIIKVTTGTFADTLSADTLNIIDGVTDNCPGPINCVLSVISNEPVNGVGDGNTSPDWEIINNHIVKLRAERSGTGTGRVYTITMRCTDLAGNTSEETTTVTVPHDMSVKSSANPGRLGENTLAVSVYNNPTKNYFTLSVEPGTRSENVSVRLFDMTGRMVEAANSSSQIIRVGSTLGAGIYMAEIRSGDKVSLMKLIKLE